MSPRRLCSAGLDNPIRWSILALGLIVVGCRSEGEIRTYEVPQESERIVTSDILKSEFGAIPFDWKTPESWQVADNDQFSKVAWEVGGNIEPARITVSDVSMGMGLVAQLNRWRGQIGLKSDGNPMDSTEQLKLSGATATWVDFEGKEQSILGLMVPHESKLWVFKFRGATDTVQSEKERFRSFCESVRIP